MFVCPRVMMSSTTRQHVYDFIDGKMDLKKYVIVEALRVVCVFLTSLRYSNYSCLLAVLVLGRGRTSQYLQTRFLNAVFTLMEMFSSLFAFCLFQCFSLRCGASPP